MFALLIGVQEVVGVPFLYLSVFLVRRFMHVYTLPLTPDPIESRLQKGKKWNRSLTVMHITLTARHNGSPQHVPGKDRLQVMQAARGSGFFGVDSAHDVGRLSLRLVRLEWAGTLTHRSHAGGDAPTQCRNAEVARRIPPLADHDSMDHLLLPAWLLSTYK